MKLGKNVFYVILLLLSIPSSKINSQIMECQNENKLYNNSGVHFNYNKLSKLILEENYKKVDTDTIMINGHVYFKKGLGLKAPEAAFFLAIIPGVLFHGMGHLYAGKPKDALVIFGISAGSVLGMVASYGTIYTGAGGIYFLFIGLFFATWAYDIIVSPIICIKENRSIMDDLTFYPYMDKDRFGNQLGFRLSYHF